MTPEESAADRSMTLDRQALTPVLIVGMVVGATVLASWLPYLDAGPWPLFVGLTVVTVTILYSSGSIATMPQSITTSARCWFLTGFVGSLALTILETGSISSDGAGGGMLMVVALFIYALIAAILGAIVGVVAHIGFLVVRGITA